MASGSPFVRLLSAERHVFVVERRVVLTSGMIKTMLAGGSGGFAEGGKGEVEFPEIQTAVLEKVIAYMHYKVKHHNSKTPIPDFEIAPEMALSLLSAANYLDL